MTLAAEAVVDGSVNAGYAGPRREGRNEGRRHDAV